MIQSAECTGVRIYSSNKSVDVAGCDEAPRAGGGRGGAGGQAELPLHPPRQENWAPGQPGR